MADVTSAPSLSVSPLAELGHELRTPLTAMLGYADAMRTQAFGPLDAKYARAAEAIHAAGLHLLTLVNDMTDIGRVETGRGLFAPEVFEIGDVVRTIVAMLDGEALRAQVSLEAGFDPPEMTVKADSTAVKRILINLLANSLRATPAGGKITLNASTAGQDLLITVVDTGPGPGSTPFAQGEGLGLLMTRALCALHGGELDLADAPGGGAIATVRLPILGVSG
jgi:cell cycle sensor histidine kinase DivJ